MNGSGRRKVAFVTGASSGIGRATAHAFVQRGFATALVDRDVAAGLDAEKELGQAGECKFVRCDVTDDDSVRAAVETTVRLFGRLDAAFNAAGIDGEQGKPVDESSMENWNRVIAVDLTGVFSCMRHQIPEMLKSGGGSIVNCSSVAGVVGAPFSPAYVTAKHGVIGLTRGAALEYARRGIRVNAVCPGMIATPMSEAGFEPELAKRLIAESPIGRFGHPDEIAAAVLWLCDEGSSFMTGQAMVVDGGWTTR